MPGFVGKLPELVSLPLLSGLLLESEEGVELPPELELDPLLEEPEGEPELEAGVEGRVTSGSGV